MLLDRLDSLIFHRAHLARHPEGAVFLIAPCPSGNLREFLRIKRAHPPAVKLRRGSKGDVLDIEIQPHANRIGRHQIIDIAVLIQGHLRVAGARAQRAHHHRATALGAADQLGNRIDVFHRKPNDGRAFWHPADFFRAGIGQLGKPFALDELHILDQPSDGRTHGFRPQKQRLMQAPRPQQTVGEHMTPLWIGTKLNLIHCDKIGTQIQRHCLNGADPILCTVGNNAFFARDQCHHRRAARGDNPVVNLARQQPQRQANHPSAMPQHPLDRVMSFSGVGRPKHRRHLAGSHHICGPAL